MPTLVPGQMASTIYIDGDEFPLSTNPINQIFIVTNTKQLLPVLKMQIADFGNFFGRHAPLNDGTKISINIGDGNSQSSSPQFSNFSTFGTPKRVPTRDYNIYNVLALLDAVPFVRATVNQAITGTSVNVMQKIAQAMNFTLQCNFSTNDSMTWRSGRQHWGNFMNHVARHGYIDNMSCMHAAVDEQHNIYYQNITDIFANGQIKAVIFYGATNTAPPGLAPKTFQALQHKAINRSGYLNNNRGYGLRMTQVDPIMGQVNKFTTVVAQTVSNNLDMSKNLQNIISPVAKIELPPLNMNNVHPKFFLARHQNSRLKDTYSQNVYVTIPHVTGLNIYDLVQFNSNSTAYGPDYAANGFYVVTAKTRCLLGNKYMEKIELCASGPQANSSSLV